VLLRMTQERYEWVTVVCHQASVAWLDEAECRLDNLSTVSDNVRDVRIQLEQLKVTLHSVLD